MSRFNKTFSRFMKSCVLAAAVILSVTVLAPVQAPAAGKVLTVGVAAFPDSLDTGLSSYATANLLSQMYEPLVVRDDNSQLLPCLAVSWDNPTPTVWRFKLRENVSFHDGAPFTADDVVHTFEYILGDPLYANRGRISPVESVRKVDTHIVEFETKAPFPTMLIALSDMFIQPRHYQEKVGREGMRAHPIGTGPFVFAKWVPGDSLELTANDAYWGGRPKVDKVLMRQIPEGSTRVASLLAGETQIIEEVPMDLLAAIERNAKTEVASVESTVGLLVTYDARKAPFDNPLVREALDYAVNKPLILEKLLYDNGKVLDGQMLTSNTFGHNPNLRARPYDPAKAKALLAEAGYPDGFSTSITTRSGKYLSDVDITNAIAGNLLEIGVKAEVNVVEGGVFSKMIKAQDLGPMHIVGWYSIGDADFATVWFTQESQRAFWKNEEYEDLFIKARSTVDQAERQQYYNRMMEIFHEENPAICLFGLPSVYGKAANLTGWSPPADKSIRLHTAEFEGAGR